MKTPTAEERRQEAVHEAYLEAVAAVEAELGAALPRFRGVEYTFAGYQKPSDFGQWPYYRRFPDLAAKPWWSLADFPEDARAILARFEAEQAELRAEFEAGVPQARGAFRGQATGYFGVADRWLSYALVTEEGKPVPEAFARFPRLAALLGALVERHYLCKTYFALMMPGVHLEPHCGGHNITLRTHFALRIPPGDTGIRVGGIEGRWEEGKLIFFDDTFVHDAWNRTDQDRYILLARILHPDLSPLERRAYFLIEEKLHASAAVENIRAERDRARSMTARTARAPAPRAKRRLELATSFEPPDVVKAVEQAAGGIFAGRPTAGAAIELASEAAAWSDELVERVEEQIPPERPLACAVGCAFCCHLQVTVSAPEVLRLAAVLRDKKSAADLEALTARVIAADDRTRGMSAKERAAARIPCPLLEDNRCSAYAARPLACRGATSYDAEACERGLAHPDEQVPGYEPEEQVAQAVRLGVQRSSSKHRVDPRPLELNAALRIALADPAAGEAWARGEALFTSAVIAQKK
jgi:aspartyl/asparaginyl beta-hydroxylase (cupin superfamily)/Fe-S-cluster containining protein